MGVSAFVTSTNSSPSRPRGAWIPVTVAALVAVAGATFYVTQLDPFVAPALLPPVAALTIAGVSAHREGHWPSRWQQWLVAAFVAGLLIYGIEYWLYGLTHPPVAV